MTKQNIKIILSNEMIETQVSYDLISFQKKIKKAIMWPIDLEYYIESLWGLNVLYDDNIIHPESKEEIVGYLSVPNKEIGINLSANKNEGRINFTLAHEIGHVSLHSTLGQNFAITKNKDTIYCRQLSTYEQKANEWRLEQQANCYATNLLMPKSQIFKEINYNELVDLSTRASDLMHKFSVSRKALELRLYNFGFKVVNNKYHFN